MHREKGNETRDQLHGPRTGGGSGPVFCGKEKNSRGVQVTDFKEEKKRNQRGQTKALKNVLYHDCHGGFNTVEVCQNSLSFTLECKLHLHKADKKEM